MYIIDYIFSIFYILFLSLFNTLIYVFWFFFFFSSRRRHTRFSRDWSFRRVLFRSARSGRDVLVHFCSGRKLSVPLRAPPVHDGDGQRQHWPTSSPTAASSSAAAARSSRR